MRAGRARRWRESPAGGRGARRSRGIRIKSFEAPTRARGRPDADRVRRDAAPSTAARLDGFVVTLPKVTSVDQVEAMVHACERSRRPRACDGSRFEIQVETPQSILGPDGTALVARMVHAAAGGCTGLHYGTYDYSAFCGIAAGYQSLEHPVADHAKLVMQAAAAGTGVRLSDGSTNVLPVGDADAVRRGVGATTTGWCAARWSAATTRAGTCTRPSCRRGTPRRTPSTATASPVARRPAAATTSTTPRRGDRSTSRRPPARWRDYVLRGRRLRRRRRGRADGDG